MENRIIQLFQTLPADSQTSLIKTLISTHQTHYANLSSILSHTTSLLRIDPVAHLPSELVFKLFQYLDANSLCRAACVCKAWAAIANDDVLWRNPTNS